jgi:uncharacterized protein YndB with AHSA1/START domain
MAGRADGFELRTVCVVEAARDRVFRLLTEPTELARWWGPRGFTTPRADVDLRVGGGYRFAMQPPDGDTFHLAGEFLEVEPPGRLVYTFRWEEPAPDDRETVVTLRLEALGETTEISLLHGRFATEERLALHREGWRDSFERLQALVRSS